MNANSDNYAEGFLELPAAYRENSSLAEDTSYAIRCLHLLELAIVAFDRGRSVDFQIPLELKSLHALNTPSVAAAKSAIKDAIDTRLSRRPQTVDTSHLGQLHEVHGVRPILRGFVEIVRTAPIIPRVDREMLAYLLSIEGSRDTIHGEHHPPMVGWHYHYCFHTGKRSNTMLSFDVGGKIIERKKPDPPTETVPLFYEKHSDGHKSARPDLWGIEKCRNVHNTCDKDRKSRPNTMFRRPKNTASAVWPIGSILSPRSSSR